MKTSTFCLLFIVAIQLNAQNFIGMEKDSISAVIRKTEKSFRLDNSTVNKVYKYLKYVDRINEQTWLFFLNENDICTHHKLMSDYLNYQDVIEKLNKTYTSATKDNWEYSDNGVEYSIHLKEGEWFFTVLTREKEK